MDLASIFGLTLAVGCVLAGNVYEGGHIGSLLQLAAAIIVLGGALGAVMLQNSVSVFFGGLMELRRIFMPKKNHPEKLLRQIVEFSQRSRREGLLSLEQEIPNIDDAFMSKALAMAVDGMEPKVLYESLEAEMETIEEHGEKKAKVWEAMGGYMPTVGILGAVLGLIHVMQNLSDPTKLGSGIATAFVATVYGVGGANLVCLPIANKIKDATKAYVKSREIILRGVMLIQEGANHSIISQQLIGFLDEKQRKAYEALSAAAE